MRKKRYLVLGALVMVVFVLTSCVQNTHETQSTVTLTENPPTMELSLTVEQSQDPAEESAEESSFIVEDAQTRVKETVSNVENQTITEFVAPTPRPDMVATDPATVVMASGEIQLVEFFAFW